MFLPFGQIGQKPQPPQPPQPNVELSDSPPLCRLQNLSNWQFRSLFFAIGLTSANFARPNPSYFWLYVVGVAVGGLALMFFPPSDSKYQSLWRTGGIALFIGALSPWWDLLKLLKWWDFAGFGVVVILGLIAFGSGGNSK
jgi:hypothetical protein